MNDDLKVGDSVIIGNQSSVFFGRQGQIVAVEPEYNEGKYGRPYRVEFYRMPGTYADRSSYAAWELVKNE